MRRLRDDLRGKQRLLVSILFVIVWLTVAFVLNLTPTTEGWGTAMVMALMLTLLAAQVRSVTRRRGTTRG